MGEVLFMDDSLKEFQVSADAQEALHAKKGHRIVRANESRVYVPHEDLTRNVLKTKDLSVMTSTSTLMRARYGQDILQEQVANLDMALDQMGQTCGELESETESWTEGSEAGDTRASGKPKNMVAWRMSRASRGKPKF